MTTNDHLLAGPYALDAIDDDERQAFDDHMFVCATCALEVQGFRETVGLLAEGFVEPPPSYLLDRVLDEVRATPQLPPLVGRDSDVDQPVDDPPTDVAPPDQPDRPAKVLPFRSRRRARWLLSVAAIVALVLGATVATTVVARSGRNRDYTQVADGPGTTHVLQGNGGIGATLKLAEGGPQAAITATNLPAIPSDKTYELWYLDGNGAHPATTFRPDDKGSAQLAFASPVSAPQAFGITIEPEGGSNTPTMPIVAQTTT